MDYEFFQVEPGARMPTRGYRGDAGFDLYSMAPVMIPHGGRARIHTGVRVTFPAGFFGFITDRSSLALGGLYVHGGIIDEGYTEPVTVLLLNLSGGTVNIREGAKVAQLLILPRFTVPSDNALPARGSNGFGSTGA